MKRVPCQVAMKQGIITGVIITLIAFTVGAAGASDESGLGELDAFLRASHLAPDENMLGMVGFHGAPQPDQWLFLTSNAKEPDIFWETIVARGQILGKRQFTPLPGQDVPHLPIERKSLVVDSLTAFETAGDLALKRKTRFESVHYQLRVRDLRSEPVWVLNLMNDSQVSIGIVYISASTGTVLRESWVSPSEGVEGTRVSAR